MNNHAFPHHRSAALTLLCERPGLSHKEAGFLGHVTVAPTLSDKQRQWLVKLLSRHGLQPLGDGEAA